MDPIYKATTVSKVNNDRTARFVASDESIDRYGDSISVNGWDTRSFERNPQFLFSHNSHQLPIGKVTDTWVKGKQFLADVEFAEEGLDDFADKTFKFLQAGLLSAVSVGFMSIKQEPRYDEEGRWLGTKFLEQELLELSLVPVPANANAIQVAKSFNFSDQDLDLLFASTKGHNEVVHARNEFETLSLRLSS